MTLGNGLGRAGRGRRRLPGRIDTSAHQEERPVAPIVS
jgi:hypothetical protein